MRTLTISITSSVKVKAMRLRDGQRMKTTILVTTSPIHQKKIRRAWRSIDSRSSFSVPDTVAVTSAMKTRNLYRAACAACENKTREDA